MPDKVSFFVKDEMSYSINDRSIGNYFGVGTKVAVRSGNYEGMLAFKSSQSSKGGFAEFKYTTPKITDNFMIESRSRLQIDSSGNSFNTRLAGKYSKDFNNKINLYEIAGVSSKFSFDGNKSITPTSITGFGYNINKNLNSYAEIELSRTYNISSGNWNKVSPGVYLGLKYSF